MTTSSTFLFGTDTPFYDLMTEAYERIGRQASTLSANDADSARRSLSYLMSDWSNRGPNLWTITQTSSALTANQTSYTLAAKNIDIVDAFIRQNSLDYIISPISISEYDALPDKTQTSSRPTQFFLDRQLIPVMYFWPLPQDATCTLFIRTFDMTEDVGAYGNTLDAPQRWFEAMASGMAARLAVKWAPERAEMLNILAEAAFSAATAEDTQNVPLRIAPDMLGRRWA